MSAHSKVLVSVDTDAIRNWNYFRNRRSSRQGTSPGVSRMSGPK